LRDLRREEETLGLNFILILEGVVDGDDGKLGSECEGFRIWVQGSKKLEAQIQRRKDKNEAKT